MNLKTLEELERSIGGRPKFGSGKVRLTFYLSAAEAQTLKEAAIGNDQTISQLVRMLVRAHLSNSQ